MTDFLADPILSALLNPWHPSAANPCADRLTELGAMLSDVLLLYAGAAPEFVDGIPQAVLVAWLRANEPYSAVLKSVIGMTRMQVERLGRPRWQQVEAIRFDEQNLRRAFVMSQLTLSSVGIDTSIVDGYCKKYPDLVAEEMALHIRDLKRRVLRLFPDVVFVKEWRGIKKLEQRRVETGRSNKYLDHCWLADGERIDAAIPPVKIEKYLDGDDVLHNIRQCLAAPDWIPPEPKPEYPSSMSGVSAPWLAAEPIHLGEPLVRDLETGLIRRPRAGETPTGIAMSLPNGSYIAYQQLPDEARE